MTLKGCGVEALDCLSPSAGYKTEKTDALYQPRHLTLEGMHIDTRSRLLFPSSLVER